MIDPILSLAFSIHSNPGVYALLIGSGVSRAAQIPTGWEIVLDLIRRVARLQDDDCEPEPDAWFKAKFGMEPDYSMLLDRLSRTPAERSQLLRAYFEPAAEEQEAGIKMPTAAHHAIADLVARGYIRVIITTNFDRLLERALEAQNVTPTVISTPDAAEGALPLQHNRCVIIKVHGDYLDTRIKNTASELANLDPRINQLLDRVFDEYGLLVCGWSAKWDVGLRAALERCKNHRFATYWTTRSSTEEAASRLITLRRATVIRIDGADQFFRDLADKVLTLEDYAKPHPMSAALAKAAAKKYLAEPRYLIQLHDLVTHEVEKVVSENTEERFPITVEPTSEDYLHRLRAYESMCEVLLAILTTGCYWGDRTHDRLWSKCIQRLTNVPHVRGFYYPALAQLRWYPALLAIYAGGIAALASENYHVLKALLLDTRVRDIDGEDVLVRRLHVYSVGEGQEAKLIPGKEREYTPLSNHVHEVLRDHLRDLLPDDRSYDIMYDRLEYFVALLYADLEMQVQRDPNCIRIPVGRFGWRAPHGMTSVLTDVQREVEEQGATWAPLKAGLFGGALERFQKAQRATNELVERLQWW